MPAAQPVALVEFGKPPGWPFRDEVGPQSARIIRERASDDLFDFAFVQVDAGPEHS
jgi:hypothetical protein